MQSAAVLRPLSQTRKVEGSICIRRLSQSPSVALGDSSRHVSLPSGLSLEARSVNKRDGESLCIVRSAVMEGSSSWDGDSWSIVSTKSYRFLCNSMSPFSRKNVYGGECINPNAKRFEVKYKQSSPAMLEGFTDHCLTLDAGEDRAHSA